MAFPAVERFEQEVEAGFLGVLAQLRQDLDEEFAGFPLIELGLVGAGRHHDHPGGAQGAGGGQHFFQALHAFAAFFFLVRNEASFHAAANDAYFYLAAA